ncbi:MAG: peroxide stress protein YaaA [Gammaproteobacteria bacterium]|nr:peroxide stress protein YaaA [Gammaproteobacteria bacterium]MBT8132901.1 peroxide stress protein YaaA [Gammaproteobacteria bacterium]NNJ49294.1 peroxide stress protein YaaA [Gammaproteobacteria bacterium]
MLITLSPSKGQDFEEPSLSKKYSKPADLKDSELLIKELRKIKSKELQEMMTVSENIADLNVERYKTFQTPFTTKNAKQAIFAFKGDVYGGLDLASFDEDDFSYAQDHLRILSGLYGCLRPLDLIQPYRLEMKTKLKNARGDNLYQFWDDRITKSLNKELKKQQEPVLVNLASNEYFKSVKPKLLEGRLLNINFKETKAGKTRVVAIFAKRARGMMADYIIRNRIEKPEDLKKFKLGGYKFDKNMSDDKQWTFKRPQP